MIGADGVTPWDTGRAIGYNPDPGHYYLYVEIGPPNGDIFVVTLSQDPKTGLYEANTSQSVGADSGAERAPSSKWEAEPRPSYKRLKVPLSWTRR